MPLYEYRCTKCGHRFEKIQSFSSAPETECPKCHGTLERPLTAPALQFKGAGWYVNDYAGKSSGASGGESAKPASEAGGDAKPAATESSPASTPAPATGSAGNSSTPSASTK